jgi:ATP synthase protein I
LVTLDLPEARRLAFTVVAAQAAVTGVAALIGFVMAGSLAAVSAAIGGGISTVASLAMALLSFGRRAGTDPERVMGAFYVGEAVKLAIVVVLFVLVLRTVRVLPLALFAGFIATFLVYWIALANALPPLGGKGGPRGPRK